MSVRPDGVDVPSRRAASSRWVVHLGLISTAAVSLVVEPMIALHVLLGVVFAVLVVAHLGQRRRVSVALARRLANPRTLPRPAGRLALADALLTALTVAMLASGFWDWFAGHPTRIRWHALTGVALAGYLLVHTVRRRRRLRSSSVR